MAVEIEPTLVTGPTPPISRRAFLLRASATGAAIATGLMGYARYVEPFEPEWTRVPLDLPELPDALVGFRILQLSDIHLSGATPGSFLRGQFARCNGVNPDLIVVTGDLLTYGQPRGIPEVAELIGSLQARCGVFVVLGNHDYHFGASRQGGYRRNERWPKGGVGDVLTAALRDAGVEVLRNSARAITHHGAELQVTGVEDLISGYYDPRRAFREIDPRRPCIALTHNPDAIADLRRLPCDWVLAGHTHGGQIRLPGIGALVLPNRTPFDQGLFQVGDTRLYVNRGLGQFVRVRFNCRPEITEFTLVRREC